MRVFLRSSLVPLLAILLVLIPLGQAQAAPEHCGQTCKQQEIQWYWSSMQTKARQWYGAVIAATPQARCVRAHESDSAGGYRAQNTHSTASGAYQFLDFTSDNAARAMGRPDLLGVAARAWAPWDQDAAFGVIWSREGGAPWFYECGDAPLGG